MSNRHSNYFYFIMFFMENYACMPYHGVLSEEIALGLISLVLLVHSGVFHFSDS
jgi:hypothetical protein